MEQPGGYKGLKILFAALLTGQLLFTAVSLYLATQRTLVLQRHNLNNVFMIVLATILLLLFITTAPQKNKVCNHLGIGSNDLDAIA